MNSPGYHSSSVITHQKPVLKFLKHAFFHCLLPYPLICRPFPDYRVVVYARAMELFRALEEEVLRCATHHCDAYAQQLHAGGRGGEAQLIDWCVHISMVWQAGRQAQRDYQLQSLRCVS